MNKILEVRNVIKKYNANTSNEVIALNNVNVDVYEGDFICVMGPSGSGKSTFINNLSTIDIPTSGDVIINGKDVRSMMESELGRFRSSNLGFVFQSFNLMNTLTIYENMALPLTLANKNDDEIDELVKKWSLKLEFIDLLDKYPYECSGGQCQRCAIARSLINSPKLVVADEPTGNLDSKNSHEILRILKELNDKENITIIMVTHDSMIASYSKKMIYIRDGQIEETVEKKDCTQKDYFKKISNINNSESLEMLGE